jgi:hypothetical protein
MQERNSLLSRDIQLACLDVIRYTTDAGGEILIIFEIIQICFFRNELFN